MCSEVRFKAQFQHFGTLEPYMPTKVAYPLTTQMPFAGHWKDRMSPVNIKQTFAKNVIKKKLVANLLQQRENMFQYVCLIFIFITDGLIQLFFHCDMVFLRKGFLMFSLQNSCQQKTGDINSYFYYVHPFLTWHRTAESSKELTFFKRLISCIYVTRLWLKSH